MKQGFIGSRARGGGSGLEALRLAEAVYRSVEAVYWSAEAVY